SLIHGTTNVCYEDSIGDSSTYYYRITANNADGLEGEASSIVSVETDIEAPTSVIDLKISSAIAETGQIKFTWTAPSENIKLGYYIIKTSANSLGYDDWENAVFVATVPASALTGNQETFETTVDSTSSIKYFALKAFDSYDNASTVSNSAIFDLIVPTVSFTSSIEPDSTVSRPFSIQIESSDNHIISKIQILADSVVINEIAVGAYSYSGSFLLNIADYEDGYHVFSVKAFDSFGNTAKKELPVLINYSPPAAPIITSPEDGFALSTSTVFISGNSEPGVYISIFINSGFTASTEGSSSGDFSISDVPLGGDGAISITAQAVDSKGSSPHSTAVSGVVDTGSPNAPKNLSADSLSGGGIKLIWSLPDGEIPASYKIYRSTQESALVFETSPDSALLVANNITTLEHSNYPSQDNIYYYGIISVDAAGNESFLSNIAYGLSDRLAPTASVSLSSAPPLGAGDYRLELTISETLFAQPFITFIPFQQYPIQINLEPSSPYLWIGTFTVTQTMASGEGKFAFQGLDLSNNAGETITAGETLLLETVGPVASVSFDSLNSYLKAGDHAFKINLDKPAIGNPSFFFSTNSVDNIPVYVSSSTDDSVWIGTITVNAEIGEGIANFSYSAYDALGNKGELIEGTTFFIIDTERPGKPLSLNASVGAAGVINLSWSASLGEEPSFYCLYRDAQLVSCSILPNSVDLTGFYADNPLEGAHDYVVSSLDMAGNESEVSNSTTTISDSIAPEPPTIMTVSSNETISIDIEWTADAAEVPASFRLYRSTFSSADIEGFPYNRIVFGSSAIDTPEQDGVYFYILTALDSAGNESAISNEKSITYDIAAPIISISISDGVHYKSNVAPVFEAHDINLDASSLQASLNGLPFISGSVISAQGDYILT
ncbi:MAG: hypothetical protein KAJ48_09495, partial [Elusimicrobiales bacterium]|nr:hypothetical protein [Elusimicrobiales bacterium]